MKKITAIIFLFLFAFNWFGYRIMFDYMQKSANKELEVLLDSHSYKESDLIEIKIPVHVAYQNSWTSYERYDGEIEMNGVKYKYVKRKLSNDTLYLKCIPNADEMRLQTAKNDFFKLSNNLVQDKNSKKADNSKSVFKNLQTVFDGSSFGVHLFAPATADQHWYPIKTKSLPSIVLFSPEQPPDFIA